MMVTRMGTHTLKQKNPRFLHQEYGYRLWTLSYRQRSFLRQGHIPILRAGTLGCPSQVAGLAPRKPLLMQRKLYHPIREITDNTDNIQQISSQPVPPGDIRRLGAVLRLQLPQDI